MNDVGVASTDFILVFFSGVRTALADAKDNLATKEAFGVGDSTMLNEPMVDLLVFIVFCFLPLGVLPRLGNSVAQPTGCLVGETCVVELLVQSSFVSILKFPLTTGKGDI